MSSRDTDLTKLREVSNVFVLVHDAESAHSLKFYFLCPEVQQVPQDVNLRIRGCTMCGVCVLCDVSAVSVSSFSSGDSDC